MATQGTTQGDAMSNDSKPPIRVFKPGHETWSEAWHGRDEKEAPGRESTVAESPDAKFSAGWWERDDQSRHFTRAYHEVAIILEGEVELTLGDGTVLRAGPGDIVDTPKGSSGYWQNLGPVRKFWAIYEHD
jgi:uncharacterized cupin superfamily protein